MDQPSASHHHQQQHARALARQSSGKFRGRCVTCSVLVLEWLLVVLTAHLCYLEHSVERAVRREIPASASESELEPLGLHVRHLKGVVGCLRDTHFLVLELELDQEGPHQHQHHHHHHHQHHHHHHHHRGPTAAPALSRLFETQQLLWRQCYGICALVELRLSETPPD
ncbi:hypothetical protein GGR56DRAFT_541354 [Xylariaceae sp. FL0804]|nr:hypothetical protein GGR56DRAFT_541354 [Xylariaceae sp. FL0804]